MRFRARYLLVCMFTIGSNLSFAQDFGGGFGGGQIPQDRQESMHDVDLSAEIRELRQVRSEDVVSPRGEHSQDLPLKKIDNTFEMPPAMARIHQSLVAKGDFDFHGTPIREVIQWLEANLSINVKVHQQAVEDEGIDIDSDSITFHANNMTYRAALRYMLDDLHLTYALSDGVVLITSKEAAEEMLHTRVYPVWDLVRTANAKADYDTLIGLLTSIVVPDSWDDVGGPGSIGAYKGMLLVANTREVHGEIVRLLVGLRTFSTIPQRRVAEGIEVVDLHHSDVKTQIQQALKQPVRLEFVDTPLADVLDFVQEISVIPIRLDRQALADESIDPATDTVSISLDGVSLRSALRLMLDHLNLTFVAEQEILIVTSKEKSEETLVTRVYQCSSLIDFPEPANRQRLQEELESLSDVIQHTIAVDSWDRVGGPASIGLFPVRGLLVISQVDAGHAKIQEVLEVLARGRTGGNASPMAKSLDPAEIVVKSYALSRRFLTKETQLQLVHVLERLLNGTDRDVNLGDPQFEVKLLGQRLLVSHRRDVQEPLRKILKKLGALSIDADSAVGTASGGGMF